VIMPTLTSTTTCAVNNFRGNDYKFVGGTLLASVPLGYWLGTPRHTHRDAAPAQVAFTSAHHTIPHRSVGRALWMLIVLV
jgi:hypothetical protein